MANETAQITTRDRKPVFYLWVAGVDVLYGSLMPPDRMYSTSQGSEVYRKAVAVVPGRGLAFNRRLNIQDHIIEADPVTVVLACDDQHVNDDTSTDPVNVFGRFGYDASGGFIYFQQGQSIMQSDPVPITVSIETGASPTFSVGDVVHVGREAFEVGAIDNVAKTITFNKRGLMGTPITAHLSDPVTLTRPVMTKKPVYFKGRRAIIYEAFTKHDGSVGDYVERWRGFVAHEPEFGTTGPLHTLTIKISPLTALLDVPLGDKMSKVNLSSDFHTFGRNADAVPGRAFTGTMVDCYHHIDERAFFDVGVNMQLMQMEAFENSGGVPVSDGAGVNHASKVHPGAANKAHPMSIAIRGRYNDTVYIVSDYLVNQNTQAGRNGEILDIRGLRTPNTVPGFQQNSNIDPGVPNIGSYGGRYSNVAAGYWRNVCIIDKQGHPDYGGASWPQTYRWPDRLTQVINDDGTNQQQPGWRVGFGAAHPLGAWLNVSLNTDNRAAPFFRVSNNMPNQAKLYFHNGNSPFDRPSADSMRHKRVYGANMSSLGTRWNVDYRISPDVLLLGNGTENPLEVVVGADDVLAVDTQVAQVFYQAGESWIVTTRQVIVPASGTVLLECRQEDNLINTFKINQCTAIQVDGVTLYRCRISSDFQGGERRRGLLVTMAQMPGDPPFELSYAASFTNERIGEICLQLLCSSGGGGVTSLNYDTLTHGGGLTDKSANEGGADVDVNSFLSLTNPVDNAVLAPTWRSGQSIFDVISGLLRAAGAVLDIRTDKHGKCKLAAVPLGFPSVTSVVETLTEADVADRPHPQSPAQVEVFNSYIFRFNHDEAGDAQGEQKVKDQISIDTFGSENEIDVELYGIQLAPGLEIIEQLRPMFMRLRYDLAYPRRIWKVGIRAGLAVRAAIGGTYKISNSHLRGHSGRGVTAALARMRSIKHEGWKGTARAEFVYYGTAGAGWAPSLRATASGNATSLTVENDYYGHNSDSATGDEIEDLTGFDVGAGRLTVGDHVYVYPRGDMDSGTALTVAAVNKSANTITFGQAHGIATGLAVVQPIANNTGNTLAEQHAEYGFIGAVVLS